MKNHFSLTEVIFILVNIYNPKYKKPNIEIELPQIVQTVQKDPN